MTSDEYAPLSRTGSSRHATTHPHQAIDAHYYNITDLQSWPIAGLLVMLDGAKQPVRAELHVDAGLDPNVQETAVRQARVMLQEHYIGGDPVVLQLVETEQLREAIDVRLPPLGARPRQARRLSRPVYGAGIAVVLLALAIWGGLALLPGRGGDAASEGPDDPAAETVASGTGNAPSEPNPEVVTEGQSAGSLASTGSSEETIAAGVSGDVADGAPDADVQTSPSGESNLPPSEYARDDLGLGVRVRIVSGLQLALRTEPGADAGEVVDYMSSGSEALIVGGPRLTPGTSDTIVWWLLRLNDGTEAWAAANTSQQTLLIPAE